MEDPKADETSTPDWLQANPGYNATEDSSAPSTQNDGRDSTSSSFLQRLQKIATIISLLLSPISIILVSLWVSQKAMGGGGVSWKQGDSGRVFNWHPVLMITAYALMNVGVLVFRASGTSAYQSSLASSSAEAYSRKRGIMKSIHGTIWSLDFIFGIVAMLAVFKSHNDPISGYIANLYSFHSWVGILVLSFFTLQFIIGIASFSGLGGASRLGTPLLMEIHKYTGTYIHILATATIMLGIQEKEGFIGCSYTVNAPDLFPLLNYGLIPSACKISHGLGLVILAMGFCTNFALARFPAI
ncbi:hypothetical protein ACHAWO_003812 [Cyclotella atomus]|jgi:cytochrome b-561|uniref:Cytochrome b561 domain-containing protein n=1 Tax=Cyclotella atomus TaxID=382360 RepID=A0ABD3NJT9_9STRA